MGKNLSQNAESCVFNNGHSTGYLRLERGTRHGDPLSVYLSSFCRNIVRIRNNDDIKGICLGHNEIKLSAYADDAYFLTSDVRSLALIFQTCETFKVYYSSLKLNLEKSDACWIGAKRGSKEIKINCKSEACWICTKRGSKETKINCKWIDLNCNAIETKISALKVNWVKRLSDSNFHSWKIIPAILFQILVD